MVKNVTLDNIPEKWINDLKRANNHKKNTIEDLIKVLRPLKEAYNADKEYCKRNNQQRSRGRQDNQNGNKNNTTIIKGAIKRNTTTDTTGGEV